MCNVRMALEFSFLSNSQIQLIQTQVYFVTKKHLSKKALNFFSKFALWAKKSYQKKYYSFVNIKKNHLLFF